MHLPVLMIKAELYDKSLHLRLLGSFFMTMINKAINEKFTPEHIEEMQRDLNCAPQNERNALNCTEVSRQKSLL